MLTRGRHGAKPTPAGEILLRHAEQIERLLDSASREIHLCRRDIMGPLNVGGTPLAVMSIIPAAIAVLAKDVGRVRIDVVEDTDQQLLTGLLGYKYDIVVSSINLGAHDDAVEDIPLFKSAIAAVFRPDHPLAGRSKVSLADLDDHQLVLPQPGGTFRTQLEAMFLMAGRRIPDNIIQTSTFATLKEIVLQSGAVTLIPHQIVRNDISLGRLVAVPLEELVGHRTFGLRLLKDRKPSPIAELFCTVLKQIAPRYDRENQL